MTRARSGTVFLVYLELGVPYLNHPSGPVKHCNYDSVAKSGIAGVEINTIILFFSDKN